MDELLKSIRDCKSKEELIKIVDSMPTVMILIMRKDILIKGNEFIDNSTIKDEKKE